jgi:hypothetical protein
MSFCAYYGYTYDLSQYGLIGQYCQFHDISPTVSTTSQGTRTLYGLQGYLLHPHYSLQNSNS